MDICVGGRKDFIEILNYQEDDHVLYKRFMKDYDISILLNTDRTIINENIHKLKGNVYTQNKHYSSQEYQFNIIDRVGSGDAFLSGFLYSYINEQSLDECVKSAISSAVLKHGIKGDFLLLSADEINSFGFTHQDIKR